MTRDGTTRDSTLYAGNWWASFDVPYIGGFSELVKYYNTTIYIYIAW